MTPVVIVYSSDRTEKFKKVEAMYVLIGAMMFFISLYIILVMIRRFRRRMSWFDSFSLSPRNPRIEYANRAHRRDNVQNQPKKTTIVRFNIDGKVFRIDD